MRTIRIDDPWLVERSRTMHAEMDAAPQDDATQAAVMERHLLAAWAERGVGTDDYEARDDLNSGLYHAHECRPDVSAQRMLLGLRFLSKPALAPVEAIDPSAPEMTNEETISLLRRILAERVAARPPETT